jgi:replicative DNA helicase
LGRAALREGAPPVVDALAEVHVAKQRNGAVGQVVLRFDGPTYTAYHTRQTVLYPVKHVPYN